MLLGHLILAITLAIITILCFHEQFHQANITFEHGVLTPTTQSINTSYSTFKIYVAFNHSFCKWSSYWEFPNTWKAILALTSVFLSISLNITLQTVWKRLGSHILFLNYVTNMHCTQQGLEVTVIDIIMTCDAPESLLEETGQHSTGAVMRGNADW